ncbi:hypothetical protein BAJT_09485 [Bacillus velezensis]|nr:hypothetical protein BSO20_02455 [Bacillus amyloliquefaciens]ARB33502.1 hypothetical protein BAJT_09485 [Bacillus velezensis]ARM28045.1 hypothetical protein B9C48_09485 [Bacillus vallismortis]AVM08462.1 hypothetical protein C6P48_09585 [Bacillus velezensis]AVV94168.1 hypothetical protein DA376_09635 [Bacillus velezensis]
MPGRSQPRPPSLYGRLKCLMSLSLPFFLYKHKNTLIPKEGTSVCQTRGSTQIPATSSDGSFLP